MALPAVDASTPAGVYGDTNALTSLTTASFTPPSGSIIVASVFSGDGLQTHGVPTGTGLTFTLRATAGTATTTARVSLYTAVGAGAATTVTETFGNVATSRGLGVTVFTGAQLAATPATHTVLGGSGAPTDTITTTGTDSRVLWLNCDWSAIDGTTPTLRAYRSSATELAYHFLSGQQTSYRAHQAALTPGAQTYGLTAPAGQSYTMAAIEIQASSAAAAPNPRRPAIANRAALIRASNF